MNNEKKIILLLDSVYETMKSIFIILNLIISPIFLIKNPLETI